MHEQFYAATLNVSHPSVTSPASTERLLQSMLLVNWDWALLIRDLHELSILLTTAPAEFDYLLATTLLKARAAYLAVKGPFACPPEMITNVLGTKRVQFAAIYYRLWVAVLAEVLAKESKVKPVGARAARLFEWTHREVERRYLQILQFIALGQATDEVIHGQTIEAWVTGTVVEDGKRVNAVPAALDVWVITESFGRHRLVRPSAQEMLKKMKKGLPFHVFMERVGPVNRTDIDFEKVIRCVKVAGFHALKYGDLEIQYYLTLTNPEKTTLYVVCADRTMRIHQRNGVMPGSRPTSIEVTEPTKAGEPLYLVTFDNGVTGIFAIDFRPHKHNEHEHVPVEVLKKHGNGPGVHGAGEEETDHGPQTVDCRLNVGDGERMVDGSWLMGKTDHGPQTTDRGQFKAGPSTGLRASNRFEIAGDYARVLDRKRKKTYAVNVLNARLSLRVFVELGIDCNNKQTGIFICDEVNKRRSAMGEEKITGQALSHLFRYRSGHGAKELYGFYGELVMVEEHTGLYWLAL